MRGFHTKPRLVSIVNLVFLAWFITCFSTARFHAHFPLTRAFPSLSLSLASFPPSLSLPPSQSFFVLEILGAVLDCEALKLLPAVSSSSGVATIIGQTIASGFQLPSSTLRPDVITIQLDLSRGRSS
jgi:hypothetical protein